MWILGLAGAGGAAYYAKENGMLDGLLGAPPGPKVRHHPLCNDTMRLPLKGLTPRAPPAAAPRAVCRPPPTTAR